MRAILDCPVHAILKIGEYRPPDGARLSESDTAEEPEPEGQDTEAEWFVR